MFNDFLKYIKQNSLLEKNDKILLAFSGGQDSVVLFHLLYKAGFKFSVAHCNFKLRGQDSEEDENFVRQLAQNYDIDIFVKSCDTRQYAKQNNISIEMAARTLRYSWFNELIKNYGFTRLAVAHHKDDNIETILNNLSRGTGLRGLRGMKPKNNNIVRPLLFANKNQIKEFCKKNNLKYRTDRTNFDIKFHRNRLRHNIIPEFRKINRSFDNNVIKTAHHLHEYEKFVNFFIEKIKQECILHNNNTILIKKDCLSPEIRSIFLFESLKNYGFKEQQIKDIVKNYNTSGKKFFSNSKILMIERKFLSVDKKDIPPVFEEIAENTKTLEIKEYGKFTFSIIKGKDVLINKVENIAILDYNKLTFPLIIRNIKNGDSFVPIGMKGKKKISDFFNDNKIDNYKKRRALILETGGKIAWLCGYRISDEFKITQNTVKALKIEFIQ